MALTDEAAGPTGEAVRAAEEVKRALDAHLARVVSGDDADAIEAAYTALATAALDYDSAVREHFSEVTPFADVRLDTDAGLPPGETDLPGGERLSVRMRADFVVTSAERLLAAARSREADLAAPDSDGDGDLDEPAAVAVAEPVRDAVTAAQLLLSLEEGPLAAVADEAGLRAAGWAAEVGPAERTLQEYGDDEWPDDPFALAPVP